MEEKKEGKNFGSLGKYRISTHLETLDYGFSMTHLYVGDNENIGNKGANLTIVILSCNRSELTIKLIDSLIKHVPDFMGEVLVYDNASDESELAHLQKYLSAIPFRYRLIQSDANFGVAGGRMRAAQEVTTEWMMLLDNDIYFTSNPLDICRKNIAMLGCKFLNLPLMTEDKQTVFCNGGCFYVFVEDVDMHIWPLSMYEPLRTVMNREFAPSLSTFLFGGSAIVNRELFFECGGFDEGMFVGFEDLDFSISLFRKGYKIGSAGIFSLVHDHKRLEGVTSLEYEKARFSNEKLFESALYFERKHGLKVWSRSTESWIRMRREELGVSRIDKNDLHNLSYERKFSDCFAARDRKDDKSRKRSVLFCIHTLGGGGAEKLLIDILQRMDPDVFDIDLCVISRGGVYYEFLPDYVNYYAYNDDGAFLDKQYDVEIAFLEGEPTKRIALHDSNAVKIAWVHTDMLNWRISAGAFNSPAEEAMCYNMMDRIIFVSQTSMQQFDKLFSDIHADKMVIPNFIDKTDVIAKSQAMPCPIEKTKLTMCTLARMLPVKGIDRLIPILSRLKKDGLDFQHWIIGDGFQRGAIESQIEALDLKDTVSLLGFQKNPFPYLKATDIFISPSLLEGLPIALGEALCLHKPIVATNVSGTAELLGYGKYGMLVDSEPDAIYEGLKEMIRSETLRNEYAQKAEIGSTTEAFDVPQIMSRINDLIVNAASDKTPLNRIAHQVFMESCIGKRPGLLNGKIGQAIFFFHYAAFTGHKAYETYALQLIDDMVKLIHSKTPIDYTGGLTGIGSGVEYIVQNGYIDADSDEVLEEIEAHIHLAIPYETDVKNLADMGRYLLSRIANPANGDTKPTTIENKIFLIHVVDLIDRFYTDQSEDSIAYVYRFLTETDRINIYPIKVKRLISEIKAKYGDLLSDTSYRQYIEEAIELQCDTNFQDESAPDLLPQKYGEFVGVGLYLMGKSDCRHKSWLQLL